MGEALLDWLLKRLPPVKAKTSTWQQLAEVVQDYWEEAFDSHIERVRSFLSVFRASHADQALMLREAGGLYERSIVSENVPIAYMTRQLEFYQKGSEHPILNAIRRAFPDLECTWEPLYAKVEDVYGTAFYREAQVESGWTVYLTSRAKILVTPMLNQAISNAITQYVLDLKPLHIVFDGVELKNVEEGEMPQ